MTEQLHFSLCKQSNIWGMAPFSFPQQNCFEIFHVQIKLALSTKPTPQIYLELFTSCLLFCILSFCLPLYLFFPPILPPSHPSSISFLFTLSFPSFFVLLSLAFLLSLSSTLILSLGAWFIWRPRSTIFSGFGWRSTSAGAFGKWVGEVNNPVGKSDDS